MNLKTALLATSVLFGVLGSSSCEKKRLKSISNDCDVVCTNEFRSIFTTVVDTNGQTVELYSASTVRNSTQEVVYSYQFDSTVITNGIYTVMNDGYQKQLKNQVDTFTFTGITNDNRMVEGQFVISADCCHINKVSGQDTIVLY